jgi:pyruvate kinase
MSLLQIRELLDSEGGPKVKIVAQIDTPAAIRNYPDLLRVSDAIMVSRTNLGMVIKPEKVSRGVWDVFVCVW